MRHRIVSLASSLCAGIGTVAFMVGLLMYSTSAQATAITPPSNCSGCLTAADSGNNCGTANTCPTTACTSCTCSAPAAGGGRCS